MRPVLEAQEDVITKGSSQMESKHGVCPLLSQSWSKSPSAWSRVQANKPAEWVPPCGVPLEVLSVQRLSRKEKLIFCPSNSCMRPIA